MATETLNKEQKNLKREALWTAARAVIEKGPNPETYNEDTKVIKSGEKIITVTLVADNDYRMEIKIDSWELSGVDGFLKHGGSITLQKAIALNDRDVNLGITKASGGGMGEAWRNEIMETLQARKLTYHLK